MQQKTNNNFILALCITALILLCTASILSPIRFDRERIQRENVVMERLTKIKQAERAYFHAHGTFAPSLKTLTASGLLADSLTLIPYSDGERFELETSVVTDKSGRETHTMECGAQYQQYLKGLDENSIANLIEDANKSGQYPGVMVRM